MIYELRVYEVHPGKMKALLDRFENHTIALFAKHGMRITQFWEDLDEKNNRLYYVVEHDSLDIRNLNYERFRNDPEWLALKQVTEENGPLVQAQVSYFMKDAFLTP
ncbi:NIPSNAP family protein [Paenibacillus rhizovicinus]|uniref:NIPSNAP family protein n=1 Tax=Paenibacillus rhizovicinus TaxID=2704463 RepID=A0A6C0P6D2_9BACL|nr:NIPSNAP family protein [Paenibacillus rhizovicinus]QHW34120.1 NIPSNAP family protein [Paenibacillus rhizovicinus]